MEITPEVAKTMIEARLHEYPQMKAVVNDANFQKTISEILDFEKLDSSYLLDIENEILMVLTLYVPLSELPANIQESTGLSLETSLRISTLIETLLLEPVHSDLVAYEHFWNEELAKSGQIPEADKNIKERLTLRPDGVPLGGGEVAGGPKPLTREEVLQALAPKRTMASDIASLQQKTSTPPVGYGAQTNTTEVK